MVAGIVIHQLLELRDYEILATVRREYIHDGSGVEKIG